MKDGPGVVVVGRNEGERLVRCLESVAGSTSSLVYVDSGSSDGSAARARALGAAVVELDASLPYTAARGRNAGFERLLRDRPDLELVQFVDGDCEVQRGWLEAAGTFLAAHPEVAAVCGRRRERHPDASPWNRMADLEWGTPVGDAKAFGGDVMLRAAVFRAVGGYRSGMIAGEDPELARRIRRAGHRIERLDHEMTLHDAALESVGQWWRRQVRAGHAYAEALQLQGRSPEPASLRQVLSIVAWGGLLPVVALLGAPFTAGASLLLLLAYPALWARIRSASRARGRSSRDASLYAGALSLGKLAEFQGVLQFAWNRWVRRRATSLIEYKGPS